MKQTILTLTLLSTFVMLLSTRIFAQTDEWVCPHDGSEGSTAVKSLANHLNFINPLPTYDGINFKIAVLYFKDDGWPGRAIVCHVPLGRGSIASKLGN